MAWAVRGRSSSVFSPSVWHGSRARPEVALTFDDGPSPSTPALLALLDQYGIQATFFQCGMHVRRFPQIAKDLAAAGHEIGNHTDTHPRLWLRSPAFILDELHRAQNAITEVTGVAPRLFRATYGVRWFGLREAQKRLGLMNVMWTTIGHDWNTGARQVAQQLTSEARNGAIYCLHDGRERQADPDIRNTIGALRRAIPVLLDRGYQFRTVSELLR